MRTDVYHGIQSVDQAAWNHLTAGYSFAGWEWCRYGEAVLGEENAYYVVVSSGNEPVAGALLSVRYREQLPVHNRLARKLLEAYLDRRPLLISRTPPQTKMMGVFLPDDKAIRNESLAQIQRAALDIAHERGVSFILFDYLPPEAMPYDWSQFQKLEGFLDEGTQLKLPYETWNAYMESVRARSKNVYKDIRRHLNRGQEAGIEVTFHPHVTQVDDAIRLIGNVNARYHECPIPHAYEMLANSPMMGGHAIWMAAHLNEKIVACGLLYYDESTGACSTTLYGRDYDYDYAYLCMIYQTIRYAIEELDAQVFYGDGGAYEFKYRLGFEPDKRNNFVFYSPRRLERALSNRLLG